MKPITLVLPYYNNAGMLRVQQESWSNLPAELRAHLHVIVVDDCSQDAPASAVAERRHNIASFRLYRTGVDVRWNWLFCRNLGARDATTPWLLLTDIDHLVPTETFRALIEGDHGVSKVYRFERKSMPDLSPYHPHPDSFFLTRDLFWRIGGYDERFSGLYGSSSDIRHRMKAMGLEIQTLPQHLIRYPREVVPDASTPIILHGGPSRKTPQDAAGLARVRAEIAALPKYEPRVCSFPYDRLI